MSDNETLSDMGDISHSQRDTRNHETPANRFAGLAGDDPIRLAQDHLDAMADAELYSDTFTNAEGEPMTTAELEIELDRSWRLLLRACDRLEIELAKAGVVLPAATEPPQTRPDAGEVRGE